MLIAFVVCLLSLLTFTVTGVYAERKVSGFIQDRLGPYEVGPYGFLQTVADLLKLLQKEDIIPAAADRVLFGLAPLVLLTAVLASFAVIPLGPELIGSGTSLGIFVLLGIAALEVIGVLMAGWGSNNKFSLYGAIRSVAQIVSYEVPLGLSVLCVVIACGTLDMQEISYQQGIWAAQAPAPTAEYQPQYLLGLKVTGLDVTAVGGVLCWNVFRSPLLLAVSVIFLLSAMAEANRAPFDLPESESEIIGGYHTEYSGFRWALLMLSEYGMMLLSSILTAVLFWGSWNTPLPNIGDWTLASWTSGQPGTFAGYAWAAFWLAGKTLIFVFVQMWARWTYPRLRVDQVMSLSWKYLTPFCLLLFLGCALWRLAGI